MGALHGSAEGALSGGLQLVQLNELSLGEWKGKVG